MCKGSDLNAEVTQVQLTQDLVNDFQTLCVRDHRIVLPSYVEILQHWTEKDINLITPQTGIYFALIGECCS